MNQPSRRGTWIVTLTLAAAAGGYGLFVYLPGRKALAELRNEIRRKQDYVAAHSTLPIQLKTAQDELAAAQTVNQQWRQRAAAGSTAPLYGKLYELAKQSGVTPTRFDPQSPQTLATLRRAPLNLTLTGDFAKVHAFLCRLEELPNPLWLDGVQVKRLGSTAGSVIVEVNLAIFADNREI
jgi:Tfp pilus assembly protein PilO